jgi:hypothetical protein
MIAYPNPAIDEVALDNQDDRKEIFTYALYNLEGQQI